MATGYYYITERRTQRPPGWGGAGARALENPIEQVFPPRKKISNICSPLLGIGQGRRSGAGRRRRAGYPVHYAQGTARAGARMAWVTLVVFDGGSVGPSRAGGWHLWAHSHRAHYAQGDEGQGECYGFVTVR